MKEKKDRLKEYAHEGACVKPEELERMIAQEQAKKHKALKVCIATVAICVLLKLEKGKEILILSELKLVLEELLIDIPVCFTAEEGERSYKISNRVKDIIKDINSMIHAAYGGNVCQRK